MILAPGEGVEPSLSGSKPDVLPVAPSREDIVDFRFVIVDFQIVSQFEISSLAQSLLRNWSDNLNLKSKIINSFGRGGRN
jgi:hypothetical protein